MHKGQSMFELVVAIAVSALVMVAIVLLVTNSIKSATYSKNNARANSLAADATEWLRSQRDTNITLFLAKVGQSYCLDTLAWGSPGNCAANRLIDSLFIRQVDLQKDLTSVKTLIHANVTVKWTDSQGGHTVVNSTDFTDWRDR